jgi:hypothetical protein
MEAEDDANISNFIRDATKFTIPQRPTTRTPKTPITTESGSGIMRSVTPLISSKPDAPTSPRDMTAGEGGKIRPSRSMPFLAHAAHSPNMNQESKKLSATRKVDSEISEENSEPGTVGEEEQAKLSNSPGRYPLGDEMATQPGRTVNLSEYLEHAAEGDEDNFFF